VALKGGKRLGTFKAVRWATKGATKRRLRLRFAGREGWIRRLGHHRALARVEVVLKDARGKTRKRVARVQVRR
jgi:hypothetical protein